MATIKYYATIAALTAFFAAIGAAYFYKNQAERLGADLDAAEQKIEAYRRATDALDDHLRRARDEAERWRQVAEETETLEGADEPLSPYARSVLDRVRQP